jgi:hypothetical protein
LVLQPEAHRGGDLVVAAAAGVEFRAGRITGGQLRLDVHVHVFEFGLPLEFAALDFAPISSSPRTMSASSAR